MAAHGELGRPSQAADLAVARGMGPDQVVDLAVAGGMGPERVGSKAFNLARLAAAGLPVPVGFVVMPEAFQAWGPAEPAVAAAARRLGGDRYAVRSSAPAEGIWTRPRWPRCVAAVGWGRWHSVAGSRCI